MTNVDIGLLLLYITGALIIILMALTYLVAKKK